MSNMCPICSEELDPAITFSAKAFYICFPCNYTTEPNQIEIAEEIDD